MSLLGLTGGSKVFEDNTAYKEQSSAVQAVINIYGPANLLGTDFPPRTVEIIKGVFGPEAENLKRGSPASYVTKDAPPFLLIHGDRDQTVPLSQSKSFDEQLRASGVNVSLVTVKNAVHGFEPGVGGPIHPSRAELTKIIADFFDRVLKPLSN